MPDAVMPELMPDLPDTKRSFSMLQTALILIVTNVISGSGGALAVKASDAVQDSKIAALEVTVAEIRKDNKKTTEAVTKVGSKVESVESAVDRVRDDIRDLRTIVIDAIKNGQQ